MFLQFHQLIRSNQLMHVQMIEAWKTISTAYMRIIKDLIDIWSLVIEIANELDLTRPNIDQVLNNPHVSGRNRLPSFNHLNVHQLMKL